MLALDALKGDETLLRKELESAGVRFKGRNFCCPFHPDTTPSASIGYKDGHWLMFCHGCQFSGSIIDVRAKLNKRTVTEELRAMNDAAYVQPMRTPIKVDETAPKPEAPAKLYPSIKAIVALLPNVEDEYSDLYADPDTGVVEFSVIRWRRKDEDKKSFVQIFAVPCGFQMKKPDAYGKYPLANRKVVRDAAAVVLVEGEKCVRALASIGIVATTTPGGALKSGLCDMTPLAGKKVIIWPDNDAPTEEWPLGKGVEHGRQWKRTLDALDPPAEIFWVEQDQLELAEKGDAADVVLRYSGWTVEQKREAIQEILDDASPRGSLAELNAFYAAVGAGKMRSLSFGSWNLLSKMTKALMPGSVTMLCGDPGATKSFMILEAASVWIETGQKWCIYQLEEDASFHMKRALAQRVGEGRITDHEWIEENLSVLNDLRADNAVWEREFLKHMTAAPDGDLDLDGLADWIEAKSREGYEIVVADPITAVDNGRNPWEGERKFLLRVKRAARRWGSRIILVTHPTKTTKREFGSHSMAGSTNYARFTQTILWMERMPEDASVYVRGQTAASFPISVVANRVVHLLKTRNSVGAGMKIAFYFDPRTLRFTELGIVAPDPNKQE